MVRIESNLAQIYFIDDPIIQHLNFNGGLSTKQYRVKSFGEFYNMFKTSQAIYIYSLEHMLDDLKNNKWILIRAAVID